MRIRPPVERANVSAWLVRALTKVGTRCASAAMSPAVDLTTVFALLRMVENCGRASVNVMDMMSLSGCVVTEVDVPELQKPHQMPGMAFAMLVKVRQGTQDTL